MSELNQSVATTLMLLKNGLPVLENITYQDTLMLEVIVPENFLSARKVSHNTSGRMPLR